MLNSWGPQEVPTSRQKSSVMFEGILLELWDTILSMAHPHPDSYVASMNGQDKARQKSSCLTNILVTNEWYWCNCHHKIWKHIFDHALYLERCMKWFRYVHYMESDSEISFSSFYLYSMWRERNPLSYFPWYFLQH